MREQQQECSEIHTIQMFRDEACLSSSEPSDRQSSIIVKEKREDTCLTIATSDIRDEEMDLISGRFSINADEDVIDEASVSPEMPLHSEGGDSLYSFYFETAVVSMADDESFDDFTITSRGTESFDEQSHLDLESMESIWERGMDHS